MTDSMSTCWTAIREAAGGSAGERERFARRYRPAVEAYVKARGRLPVGCHDLEDVVQEVFLECLKPGGVLEKASPDHGSGGFRAYLRGVTKNVAARAERRPGQRPVELPGSSGGLPEVRHDPGEAFDRAWAEMVMRDAGALQEQRARSLGAEARQRVELLRLRFDSGTPIREIAKMWDADPATLHKQYAQARREFQEALRETVAYHAPGSTREIDEECRTLLALLT